MKRGDQFRVFPVLPRIDLGPGLTGSVTYEEAWDFVAAHVPDDLGVQPEPNPHWIDLHGVPGLGDEPRRIRIAYH